MTRRLEVLLGADPLGRLVEGTDGIVEFRFSTDYFGLVQRPVLGQRFEDDLHRVWRGSRGQVLPAFFANLAPESRPREIIERESGIEKGDDLGLPAFVGGDLPGAVTVLPVGEEAGSTIDPENSAPEDDAGGPTGGLRFSIAGVRLKFSMLMEGEKLTLPAHGRSGHWIVKFASLSYPSLPENEYSMLAWARAAGFEVPDFHLLSAEAVEGYPRRFDVAAFERFASRADLDARRVRAIVEEMLATLRVEWKRISEGLPLPPAHLSSLHAHWKAVPLLGSAGPLP